MELLNNISEAERGGLIDLGKTLRNLMLFGGGGGGGSGSGAASYAEFRSGQSVDKFISPSVYFEGKAAYTLTDAANVIVNMNYGINFLLTVGGNRLLTNPINAKVGQEGIFIIQQDATGGRTLTWDTLYKFPTGSPTPTLPVAPHAWMMVKYHVQTPSVVRCAVEGSGSSPLNAATVQELWLGLESLKYASPSALLEAEVPVVLVDEEPIFVDLGEGKNFTVTLGGNRAVDSPLDQLPGRWGKITFKQDATGGRTVTFHADWKPSDGVAPTIRKAANAETTFEYRVVSLGNVRLTKEPELATLTDVFEGAARDKYLSPYSAFESMVDVVLTDGPTITPNLNQGLVFALTLGGSRHIANPTGQRAGKAGRFFIQQDDVGGHALTWDSDWKFVGGAPPVIPIEPNGWTVVPYEVRSSGNIICAAVEPYVGTLGGDAVLPASTTEVRSAAAVSKYVNPSALAGLFTPYNLPNAASVTPDLDLGLNFILTLGQNVAIQNPVHQRPGAAGSFFIIQGGSGSYTLTWGTNYTFLGGVPVMPTAVGAWIEVPYTVQAFGVVRCISIQTNAIPGAATVQEVWAGTNSTKYIPPSVILASQVLVALTDGATIPVDLNTGINFKVTLEGNRALANPTNQVAGKEGIIKVKQDAIGGRTLSYGDNYIFEGDPPVLNDDPDAVTVIPYHVESVGVVLLG